MFRRFSRGLVRRSPWVVGAFALSALAACSIKLSAADSPFPDGDKLNEIDSGVGDGAQGATDPGLDGGAPPYQGSPLCNASRASGACYPDDPATTATCNEDGGIKTDGGADAGAATVACRVVAKGNVVGPVCATAGTGKDGDVCRKGSDCAAGFECVGAGQCRQYCCANTCSDQPAFCDIQPVKDATIQVPVCMPIHSCKLLMGPCADGETCAVVKGDGTTSCVPIGPAEVGQSCDRQHCASGLVCLGAPGKRACWQLCHTDSPSDCPSGSTCKANAPLFPNPAVGICER